MSDLISREKVFDVVSNWNDNESDIETLAFMLSNIPTEEPERRKGKWEFVGLQMFVCSECKHGFRQDWLMDWRTHNSEPIFPNFCPNCGAEME